MNKNNRYTLIYYLFLITITLSSLAFLLGTFDYVGTISSSEKVNATISDTALSIVGDELHINLTFVILNPTKYFRIKLNDIYYQLFININEHEEFIGQNTLLIDTVLNTEKL